MGAAHSVSPDDLARSFDELNRSKMVFGIFLSSAIRENNITTMDKILSTATIIRNKYRFRGYIHLKIIPGAQDDQILKAMQLANRVSVNIEAPTAESLKKIAPGKDFDKHILNSMTLINSYLKNKNTRCKSHTTQYVVGAADEQDREILDSLWNGYKDKGLARGYFSAFQPVKNTPLSNKLKVPLMREHRLYQADFLFRKYDFAFDELVFDNAGNLDIATDPKTIWAKSNPQYFPMEINNASKKNLLRVPGLGPVSVKRLLELRTGYRIKNLDSVKRAAPGWRTALPYLLFDGKKEKNEGDQLKFDFF